MKRTFVALKEATKGKLIYTGFTQQVLTFPIVYAGDAKITITTADQGLIPE